ncbi:hypothetical protein METBIDRAFT_33851 [Metschnikowia bicuspidata var. bicuspidata NRRL YB-4993]|uniref:Uncharacterized protein n=1 Tax=Metschnikowia bicuspidata var. bicuspidata NRRL YB-4993 TaxID=869754 RepID=A0A1A0GZ23_9ASCO|nr:hypothetical protein METBIDRAFT_33851 [Metschnikowia bicuspidata var. bicuspidata NRRL YB-4993]OBA17024.1 hypothetical protein METBIDRAFT_33851 [Metschnikowia bicuspidata var. bicuspidata NRRL YB-4993]
MSINRINVLKPNSYQGLPFDLREGEVLTYSSPTERQSFSVNLQEPKGSVHVNISVMNGRVFVTTQRFVFITEAQGDVESFEFDFSWAAACQLSHTLKSPWFGPNYWLFLFFSPSDSTCDGFPKTEWFKGQISFKDGGLFDFIAAIDRAINDTIHNPHIDEDLPRYSET